MLKFKEIIVTKENVGTRLDILISKNILEFTRNYAQKLILKGNVLLNNRVAKKTTKLN